MKVALVHDWLNTRVGGSEKVLIELANLYPQADIYTLFFREQYYRGQIDPARVHTSYLQRLPRSLTDRPRYLLPLIPTAIESFDLSDYDVVISSSNAYSKGVITSPDTVHICYCYSPMRFAWDYWPRYLDEQHVGAIKRFVATQMISKTRLWDYDSSKRVDHWVAISQHVAKRIKKFYGADSTVIYPPVELHHFQPAPERGDYYLTLATLTPYKLIDQAIEACNNLGRRLIVIGDGFDRPRLEAMAGPTIEFAGRVSDEQKAKLLAQAKGLLAPQEEDFGIAMVEALASGTPVIAYDAGGAQEIVGKAHGLLYPDQSATGLAGAIEQAETMSFDPSHLHTHAQRFSAHHFTTDITKAVSRWSQNG